MVRLLSRAGMYAACSLHYLFQIVNVVQEDTVDRSNARVHIARQCNVDHQQGTAMSLLLHVFAFLPSEDNVRTCCCADDDVRLDKRLAALVVRGGLSAQTV